MKHSELINDPTLGKTVWLFIDEGDEQLIEQLKELKANFVLLQTEDWNGELSPWPVKAGKMSFAGGADETLKQLLRIREEREPGKDYIAGYSLAGLFAIYACRHFDGAAGCSSSLWFPGFVERFEQDGLERGKRVYLSLGNREELSRNQLLATVGDRTRELYRWLQDNGNECALVMNEGGHFDQPDQRLLRGIRWLLEEKEHGSK